LVYANGVTRTNAVIGDRLSGVHGPNLIKITRKVEVLEWRKKTKWIKMEDYYELEWVTINKEKEG
jgi:hypothetical protein